MHIILPLKNKPKYSCRIAAVSVCQVSFVTSKNKSLNIFFREKRILNLVYCDTCFKGENPPDVSFIFHQIRHLQ